MSRPQEAYKRFVKTHNYVYNLTICGGDYPLNRIVDSLKGIDDIEIDAEEVERGVYDFIVSFGTSDDAIFHQKLTELEQILKEDFPKHNFIRMGKTR